jgi:ketosteroid isomerase-like protein
MSEDERDVVAAARRFSAAIEDMIAGRGLETMLLAWHHTDYVTSKHPSGEWAHGWEEVWATWKVFSAFGRADRAGSALVSIGAHVCGEIAYTTSVFQASPAWGAEKMMCTNVLQRSAGEWKLIHHHADPSPAMGAALEKMIEEQ